MSNPNRIVGITTGDSTVTQQLEQKIRQNVLLILTGLHSTPMKFLISIRDFRNGPLIERLQDCDGGGFDSDDPPTIWLRDDILKLDSTRPEYIVDRLRDEFGAVNVFLIPIRGYLAAKLLSEGIGAVVVFECGEEIH